MNAQSLLLLGGSALVLGACGQSPGEVVDEACGAWPFPNRSANLSLAIAQRLDGGDLLRLRDYWAERTSCATRMASDAVEEYTAAPLHKKLLLDWRTRAHLSEAGASLEFNLGVIDLVSAMTGPVPEE